MMGHQPDFQHKLFITGFNLDKRIRKDHILRRISEKIDFHFIYKEVEHSYGLNGHVSVPPPVILKLMLLLLLYNVRSERELIATIPERLDWLWFLGYDLDDDIPDHSVLSKARARWGVWSMWGQPLTIDKRWCISLLFERLFLWQDPLELNTLERSTMSPAGETNANGSFQQKRITASSEITLKMLKKNTRAVFTATS